MESKDKNGKIVRKGMKVKVVAVPYLPDYMREDSLPIFQKAQGRVFEVWEIDEHGQIWIEVEGDKLPNEHSIGLEPECVEIKEI